MHSISTMKSFLSLSIFPLNLSHPNTISHFHQFPYFFFPKSPPIALQTPTFIRTTKPFSSLRPNSPSAPTLINGSESFMEARSTCGEIHVIVGPMFAGKTTALLRRIQSESDSGRRVAIIKSNKDTRYEKDSVVTHDGTKMPCWALPHLSIFRAEIGADVYEELDVIGIDEAQFFEDLYDFCCRAADHDGKTLLVAGLDGDYMRYCSNY